MADPFDELLATFDSFVDCLEADSIGLEKDGFKEAAAENNLLIIEGPLLDFIFIPPIAFFLELLLLIIFTDDLIEHSFAADDIFNNP